MANANMLAPRINELKPLADLHTDDRLQHIFDTANKVAWCYRVNRAEFIQAGAVYEICGRLLAHPERFEQVVLAIGSRTLARRHGIEKSSSA
jgi:hypothetical protein